MKQKLTFFRLKISIYTIHLEFVTFILQIKLKMNQTEFSEDACLLERLI